MSNGPKKAVKPIGLAACFFYALSMFYYPGYPSPVSLVSTTLNELSVTE
jgi:hypothetical protein